MGQQDRLFPWNLTLGPTQAVGSIVVTRTEGKGALGSSALAKCPGPEVIHIDKHDAYGPSNKDCTKGIDSTGLSWV